MSRIERTFHRSLKELKALQTNAAIRPMVARQDERTCSATRLCHRNFKTNPAHSAVARP
jgi:hypothetical protein